MLGSLKDDCQVLEPGHAAVPSCLALAAERLNDALKRDPLTVIALISMRMPCSEALAADDCPTPISDAGGYSASSMGLLNAALAINGLRVALADGPSGARFVVVG